MKIFVVILSLLVFVTFGYFVLVTAQTPICGDGIIQAPNDDGLWERCDDVGESATCTATCQAKILGWAWSDSIGWISLSDESCNPLYLDDSLEPFCIYSASVDYNIIVDTDVDATISGYAWSDSVGWICFGVVIDGVCNSITNAPDGGSPAITLYPTTDTDNPPLKGWARIIAEGANGWISLNCEETGSCDTSNFKVTYTQASFEGINANIFDGYGWNGNNDGSGGVFGAGWIQFNPPISEILPWLQTKYGDIYSRGSIAGNPIPNTAYNATYRILSGGAVITEFTSESSGGNIFVSPNFGPIDFPTPDTRYSNVLGQLDVDDLKAKADLITSDDDIPGFLAGKIYHRDGDLTIASPIQFRNGSNFDDGSGTIVVSGNLTIDANIDYATGGSTNRFRNLASVAWIVLGDLNINGSVESLAGNFIVLGNGISCSPAVTPGCGQASSCFVGSCANRLTVSGLMMAPTFAFNRTFVDLRSATEFKGSEIIIYDGRLLANTPPGLGDFAKALPIWRSGTFER